MKGKINVALKGIEVRGVKIQDINVSAEADYSLTEVKGVVDLVKQNLKELPSILDDLKKGYDKFQEVEKSIKYTVPKVVNEEYGIIKDNGIDIIKIDKTDNINKTINKLCKKRYGENAVIKEMKGYIVKQIITTEDDKKYVLTHKIINSSADLKVLAEVFYLLK